MSTTCFWCGVDPRKDMPNGISPHSTWCPHYRSPPSPVVTLPVIRIERMDDDGPALSNGER